MLALGLLFQTLATRNLLHAGCASELTLLLLLVDLLLFDLIILIHLLLLSIQIWVVLLLLGRLLLSLLLLLRELDVDELLHVARLLLHLWVTSWLLLALVNSGSIDGRLLLLLLLLIKLGLCWLFLGGVADEVTGCWVGQEVGHPIHAVGLVLWLPIGPRSLHGAHLVRMSLVRPWHALRVLKHHLVRLRLAHLTILQLANLGQSVIGTAWLVHERLKLLHHLTWDASLLIWIQWSLANVGVAGLDLKDRRGRLVLVLSVREHSNVHSALLSLGCALN